MRLERCTYPQAAAYFAEHDTVLMQFGSIEQHGRHNPLGTDLFAPSKITDLVEEQLPGLMIVPAMPFGSTNRFVDYPGTISLGDHLLYEVVLKIATDLYHDGARKFVFVNGHGGNTKSLTEVQLVLSRMGCRCALIDWWKMCGDFNPSWAGGHGGGQETSANLYIDPTMVDLGAVDDMNLINDLGPAFKTVHYDSVEFEGVRVQVSRPLEDYSQNGWIGPDHPKDASAAWGEEMLNTVANWLVHFITAFEALELPKPTR
ncbi:MAG: creatininase family protein [Coriobacteriales bacterium]|nr:creatininase family protein [Coriobacteriales bacterium]